MVRRIAALKARQQLGSLLDEVRYRGAEFIIERDGRPVAAVVPLEAYEQYRKARDEAFDRIDAVRERLAKKLPPKDLEGLISRPRPARRARRS